MDFLRQRTDSAIKRELTSIVDSYHHYWDLIAELLQNSRDAIERAQSDGNTGPHFIRVSVDAASRGIEVLDNGVGIPSEKICDVLSPGGGDKTARPNEVGEKGVGLTYAIFCGNNFEIESRTEAGGHYGGRIQGAREWLDSEDATCPPPEYESIIDRDLKYSRPTVKLEGTDHPLSSFTRVRVAAIPPSGQPQDVFGLTGLQLKFLLRTRTALGVTNGLFNQDDKPIFRAFYEFSLGAGTLRSEGSLEIGFPPPHKYVNSEKLEAVMQAFVSRTSEKQRRRFLKDKAVWTWRTVPNGEETIKVYGVMMPGNSVFEQLAAGSLKIEEPGASDDSQEDRLFRSGIFVATKGMPTGVEIPHGTGGKYPAYYRRCLFVVESDRLRFDLGRKSMHYKPRHRLQAAVSDIFRALEDIATYQGEERATSTTTAEPIETKPERDARKKAEWKQCRDLVDLRLTSIRFEKIPGGQEAGVAAIFHELLGAGLLKHYRPLSTGYGAQYDLHALYPTAQGSGELELLIEFKHGLESLVRDLENGRKYLDDIHLLVAWDADEQKLKDAGFDLERQNHGRFDGVTHEIALPIPGLDPIPVILLKDLILRLTAPKS